MPSFSPLLVSFCFVALITSTVAAPTTKLTLQQLKELDVVPKIKFADMGCKKATSDLEALFTAGGKVKNGHFGSVIKHPDNSKEVDISQHKVMKTFGETSTVAAIAREVQGLQRVGQLVACEFMGDDPKARKYYITMKKIQGVSMGRAALTENGAFRTVWYGSDTETAANRALLMTAIKAKAKSYAETKKVGFMDFNHNNVRLSGTLQNIIVDFVDWDKWRFTDTPEKVEHYMENVVDKKVFDAWIKNAKDHAEVSSSSGSSESGGSKNPSREGTPPKGR